MASYGAGSGSGSGYDGYYGLPSTLQPQQSASQHNKANYGDVTGTSKASSSAAPQSSFMFAERCGKLDMASIMRMDLRKVVENRDIDALATQLMNITYSKLEPGDLRAYTEEQIVKLFELAQLTIEYVISVQLNLANNETELRKAVEAARSDAHRQKLKSKERDHEIERLKREIRAKKHTLKAYEAVIMQAQGEKKIVGHRCRYCDKMYWTSAHRDAHVARVHVGGKSESKRQPETTAAPASSGEGSSRENELRHKLQLTEQESRHQEERVRELSRIIKRLENEQSTLREQAIQAARSSTEHNPRQSAELDPAVQQVRQQLQQQQSRENDLKRQIDELSHAIQRSKLESEANAERLAAKLEARTDELQDVKRQLQQLSREPRRRAEGKQGTGPNGGWDDHIDDDQDAADRVKPDVRVTDMERQLLEERQWREHLQQQMEQTNKAHQEAERRLVERLNEVQRGLQATAQAVPDNRADDQVADMLRRFEQQREQRERQQQERDREQDRRMRELESLLSREREAAEAAHRRAEEASALAAAKQREKERAEAEHKAELDRAARAARRAEETAAEANRRRERERQEAEEERLRAIELERGRERARLAAERKREDEEAEEAKRRREAAARQHASPEPAEEPVVEPKKPEPVLPPTVTESKDELRPDTTVLVIHGENFWAPSAAGSASRGSGAGAGAGAGVGAHQPRDQDRTPQKVQVQAVLGAAKPLVIEHAEAVTPDLIKAYLRQPLASAGAAGGPIYAVVIVDGLSSGESVQIGTLRAAPATSRVTARITKTMVRMLGSVLKRRHPHGFAIANSDASRAFTAHLEKLVGNKAGGAVTAPQAGEGAGEAKQENTPVDAHGRPVPVDAQGRPLSHDAQGRPVDAQGRPVPVDAQGRPLSHDAQGRPVDAQGRPVPVDAQGRPLSHDPQGRPAPAAVDAQGRPLSHDAQGRPVDTQGRPLSHAAADPRLDARPQIDVAEEPLQVDTARHGREKKQPGDRKAEHGDGDDDDAYSDMSPRNRRRTSTVTEEDLASPSRSPAQGGEDMVVDDVMGFDDEVDSFHQPTPSSAEPGSGMPPRDSRSAFSGRPRTADSRLTASYDSAGGSHLRGSSDGSVLTGIEDDSMYDVSVDDHDRSSHNYGSR